MASIVETELRHELEGRRKRLEAAMAGGGEGARLADLIREVDAALARIDGGSFGRCEECHDPIEIDRLLSNPLLRTCLDHLTVEERRSLEQDLDLASRVQSVLLPKPDLAVPGWDVHYHYEPARLMSGDYCDLLPLPGDGGLLFLLGDVAGKGVAASMLMAGLRATVRTLADAGLPTGQLMERANRLFCESAMPQHYATLVCGRALPSGEIEISNAGHLPPFHANDGRIASIAATGLPIGLFCSGEYPVRRIRMARGDTLLIYSDGVTETRDPSGTEYGPERLSRRFAAARGLAPQALVAACLDDVERFRAGTPRFDDLTLMAIRRS